MTGVKRIIIMGAAGRDFHNFNVVFRDNPDYRVEAFTAFQIPNIAGRVYPPELAGEMYPEGIPIHEESQLPALIRDLDIEEVVFAYSDIAHVDVMHRASLVNALGADFRLMGAAATSLRSGKPVISVCAVRTGCGKSQTSRLITDLLRRRGKSVAVVRHPMPYGNDLRLQICQRFETLQDLERHHCTIEEIEEYEPHIRKGHIVYAGVDYAEILRRAEKEADILLWDGGNNDLPFLESDLHIVLVDPLRPGHEVLYHPGEANLRMADLVLVNKVRGADPDDLGTVLSNVGDLNPSARVVLANSEVSVESSERIAGSRVLVVEDGPTLTHGEMHYGAAHVAARRFGAAEIVDPRPFAVGSIREIFSRNPHLVDVLPAMGYGDQQIRELEQTINAVPCDLVLVGTPFDLSRLVSGNRPMLRVTYSLDSMAGAEIDRILDTFLSMPREAVPK